MADAILALNAGSSSLKFAVFLDSAEKPEPLLRGQFEGLLNHPRFEARDARSQVAGEMEWPVGTKLGHQSAIGFLFAWGRGGEFTSDRLVAAGHRVVHGGMKFTRPVLIDASTLVELEALIPLAPLHQAHSLAAIEAVKQLAPELRQVACFDTSFHRTQPW
jgi:acetate kinase